MKRLAVISGKGGTGKTMVTGGLATLIPGNLVLADCDVDAANLELILAPEIQSDEPYYGLKVACIDQDTCIQCGECSERCRFGAIDSHDGIYEVDPMKCEGCAVCTVVCPVDAVSMHTRVNGRIFVSSTDFGTLAHARLEPGSGTTGLLVSEVKKRIPVDKAENGYMLIDGPPGIGCPLIATVSGVDAVLIVTEPSISGLHDLQRLIRVCEAFHVEMYVVINKYTLADTVSQEIERYCNEQGIRVVGKIPFDPTVIESVRARKPITRYATPAADALKAMWEQLEAALNASDVA
jgi:MinD superfamily P-loop ATPase